jgi:hypothetical protein
MTLNRWEERLEKHFEGLHRTRLSSSPNKPIFALEHDLSEDDRSALEAEICAYIQTAEPSDRHWLAWVVYAAELGYVYEGAEYWQTFESRTPGWLEHGDRYFIRDSYRKFWKVYGGAKPTGPWAEHFSIICWPITHAILPEDLQRQLAQILFEVRHSFRPELFDSPELLGREIAANSWRGTQRFQNLAQDALLLGQIAAALLVREEDEARSIILPATLKRISANLNKERRSREWLKDAQSYARARLRGITRIASIDAAAHSASLVPENKRLQALGIEPQLYLRPTTRNTWQVVLDIPDLAPVCSRFPGMAEILRQSRCVVTGATGAPLARGRLLSRGSQLVILEKWPGAREVLLKFERSTPELDFLLSTECMLRPGPNWLFKIAADGLAYEVTGKVVRADHSYILLTTAGARSRFASVPINVECEGIQAESFELPKYLTDQHLSDLGYAGLQVAKTVDIAPVGVVPAAWDGEGHVTWLSTDRACIAVSADFPVSGVALVLDKSVNHRIETTLPKDAPLLIELPQLSIGRHELQLVVQHRTDRDFVTGDVDILIRDPRSWKAGLTEQNPFLVVVDPPNPSLEQLWEGRSTIDFYGPGNRHVTCEVKLITPESVLTRNLPALNLPVRGSAWAEHFDKFFQRDSRVQDTYDASLRCELLFKCEEQGQFLLNCEREFAPLRWLVKRDQAGYQIQLLDDTGHEKPANISYYSFEQPERTQAQEAIRYRQWQDVPSAGGLYCARSDGSQKSIVVSPAIRSFADLRLKAAFASHSRTPKSMAQILAVCETWAGARTAGDLFASHHRRHIVDHFIQELIGFTCGNEWLAKERLLSQGHLSVDELALYVTTHPIERGITPTLKCLAQSAANLPVTERRHRFSQAARSFLSLPAFASIHNPDRCEWISELALRAMSQPEWVRMWAKGDLEQGIWYLLRTGTLVRAARFFALLVELRCTNAPHAFYLSSAWEWQ